MDNEIYIQGINAPHRVSAHEPFEVQVALHSQKAARAHLEIMRNGGFLREAPLQLEPGVNLYTFIQQMEEAGLYEYEAVVNSPGRQHAGEQPLPGLRSGKRRPPGAPRGGRERLGAATLPRRCAPRGWPWTRWWAAPCPPPCTSSWTTSWSS